MNKPIEPIKPKKPKPPMSRVIRQGAGISTLCLKCSSTMPRSGFLFLFGKRYCDNQNCENSKR